MRRAAGTWMSVVILAMSAAAQVHAGGAPQQTQEAQQQTPPGTAGPNPSALVYVAIEPAEVELGVVQLGSKVTATVRVRNTSSVPIRIEKISSDCGCVAAVPPGGVIEPGKSVSIPVTYTAKKKGKRSASKRLQVQLADGLGSAGIAVNATVVDVISARIVPLGDGTKAGRAVQIRSLDGSAVQIAGVAPRAAVSTMSRAMRPELQVRVSARAARKPRPIEQIVFRVWHEKAGEVLVSVALLQPAAPEDEAESAQEQVASGAK